MPFRFIRTPILISFIVAIALHVTAVVPIVSSMLSNSGSAPRMSSRFDPDDFDLAGEHSPAPPEVAIGIDAETPSTLTWVGYEEYREHLARLAEVEQAAFAEQSGGAQPGAAPTPPVVDEVVVETTVEADDAPVGAADAQTPALEIVPSEADLLALRSAIGRLLVSAAQRGRESDPGGAGATDSPRPTPTEPEIPVEEVPPAPQVPPGAQPGTESPDVGEPSDKESDATSVIEIPLDELLSGRPVARPGLELKPHRPRFTTLTMLTAAPGNPLTEIRFAANGIPASAEILESSGDRRVDHAVEASLFRWRASGKALEALEEERTIDVQIRILLTGRPQKKKLTPKPEAEVP